MRYLGIDLGTSFIKGAVLDLETLSVGEVRQVNVPSPLPGLPPLRTEFDPEGFVIAARRLIEELLRALVADGQAASVQSAMDHLRRAQSLR